MTISNVFLKGLTYLLTDERFLELNMRTHLKVDKPTNTGRKSFAMLEETKKLLNDFYKPYNKRLAEILNDIRYTWPQRS